jgi:hypothetical protein
MTETSKEGKQFHARENSLTQSDIEVLTQIFQTIVDTKEKNHSCRFTSISPDDLRMMVDAHKNFNLAMTDSKKVVRRFFIVVVLSVASGLTVQGFWSRIASFIKNITLAGE